MAAKEQCYLSLYQTSFRSARGLYKISSVLNAFTRHLSAYVFDSDTFEDAATVMPLTDGFAKVIWCRNASAQIRDVTSLINHILIFEFFLDSESSTH